MKIYSRDGKMVGKLTGGERPCSLEGCRGRRIGVRWSDGKLTWPCSAAMIPYKKGEKLI